MKMDVEMEATGEAFTEKRDVLATCPQDRQDRWRSTASRVGKSKVAAIRIKCLECCCWQEAEVRQCQIVNCALWGLGGQAK